MSSIALHSCPACSNTQILYNCKNTQQQFCPSCFSISYQQDALQSNSNEPLPVNSLDHEGQYSIGVEPSLLIPYSDGTSLSNTPNLEQKTLMTSDRAASDKAYLQGFTDVILRLAHHCNLQAPEDGRFSRNVSKENKHMSKKGILLKVEEWIIENKKLKDDNDELQAKNQYILKYMDIYYQQTFYELQKEICKLLQENYELKVRYGA